MKCVMSMNEDKMWRSWFLSDRPAGFETRRSIWNNLKMCMGTTKQLFC